MATSSVKPIPEGMHTLSPHIVCTGAAKAIDFYKAAFNAVETGRMPGPDGRLMHAAVKIGDSTLMLVDEMLEHGAKSPKSLGGSAVTLHLYVDDVDAAFARAVAAGAKVTMPLADQFLGRPLRSAGRPVRPQVVDRHPQARRDPRRDEEGDGADELQVIRGRAGRAA